MDATVLIDAVVRQTTALIAHLATATGGRATLAHTANQVFVDLVCELKEQGLGNKVIADMFGLALRTYHGKVRRPSESTTVRGRSLWEATLEYIQECSTRRMEEKHDQEPFFANHPWRRHRRCHSLRLRLDQQRQRPRNSLGVLCQ